MIKKLGLLLLMTGLAHGCAGIENWSELRGAEYEQLPPIKVSGTTYKVFELSRTTENRAPDRKNPNDTFAVYTVVGPGMKVYCGTSAAGCEKAIREFNSKRYKAGEAMHDGGAM